MHLSEKQSFATDPSSGADETWRAWRRHMAEVYYRLDIVSRDNDPVDGALVKRAFAEMEVSGFRAGSQRVIRSNELAKGDCDAKYVFVAPSRGSFNYRQNNREGTAGAGQAYILRVNDYYQVDIAENSEMVALVIPSRLAEERVSGIKDLCATDAFADRMIVNTLGVFIRNIVDIETSACSAYLQNTLLGMLDVAMTSKKYNEGNWRYSDAAACYNLSLLRQWMTSNLADATIDITLAASSCGLSVRYIQMILQRRGTTFGRMLVEARLDRASTLLRSRRSPPLQIGQIATLCGFKNQSHFTTRFKERFGISPRDIR